MSSRGSTRRLWEPGSCARPVGRPNDKPFVVHSAPPLAGTRWCRASSRFHVGSPSPKISCPYSRVDGSFPRRAKGWFSTRTFVQSEPRHAPHPTTPGRIRHWRLGGESRNKSSHRSTISHPIESTSRGALFGGGNPREALFSAARHSLPIRGGFREFEKPRIATRGERSVFPRGRISNSLRSRGFGARTIRLGVRRPAGCCG